MNKLTQVVSVFLSALLLFSTKLYCEQPPEEVFTNIYDNQLWGGDGQGHGTSGGGSTIETTVQYRQYLQNFLNHYKIKSVVDVGCGDWGFSHAINWNGIMYRGYDVVGSVILRNQQLFGAPNIHFYNGNGITMKLPKADLLICKDVLQHLTNEDILLFTKKFKKYKYCLITNDIDPNTLSSTNPNIARGQHRFIDLTQPPFSLKGVKVLNFQSGPCLKQVLLIKKSSN